MVRIKLIDGGILEIPREEALELLPYRGVFVSPLLRHPIEGLLNHRGKVIPVLGPLPTDGADELPVAERAWLLRMKDCCQAIRGLPAFEESTATVTPIRAGGDTAPLLEELDELLKAA